MHYNAPISPLSSQKARAHDDLCARVCCKDIDNTQYDHQDIEVGHDGRVENDSSVASDHHQDATSTCHDRQECPICMEDFLPGQLVSWSANTSSCQHAFHHVCIKEWLLRNSQCPFCREIFLCVDVPGLNVLKKATFRQCTLKRATVAANTYFCLQSGLVQIRDMRKKSQDGNGQTQIPRSLVTIDNEIVKLIGRTVKRRELSEWRGLHNSSEQKQEETVQICPQAIQASS
jgi:Ring finger domain